MNPCCRWEVVETDGLPPVHVLPAADTVAHELTEDCACGPRMQLAQRANGGDVWAAIHHKLDRRLRSAAA